MKYPILCTTLFLALYLAFPAVYRVNAAPEPNNPATVTTAPKPRVYTQAEIDQMTAGTKHPYILRTLIKCESQNTNIARMDSNGLVSFGVLQFNGTQTWAQFAPLAGVSASSSPMSPILAIKVADFMISNGQLKRWTCAFITGLLP